MKNLIITLFIALAMISVESQAIKLPSDSPDLKFSILTCTEGPNLYSLFGHTAIRLEGVISGQRVDWIYNYGTFQFSDDFYVKFAQGKLDYKLSKASFGDFQFEYIRSGRGIEAQYLNLTQEEALQLFYLLEENYRPENRVYRYDFFYDNCATRVRDILKKTYVDSIQFTYVYDQERTFREAIQAYLKYQPWSDFGIDLALGLPCDKVMGHTEPMFLPKNVLLELNASAVEDRPVVAFQEEVLPQEYFPESTSLFTPFAVFSLLFVLQFALGWKRFRQGVSFHIIDRVMMGLIGLVGFFLVFLWFFTDHTATAYNFNLMWAQPFLLTLAFLPKKVWFKKGVQRIITIVMFIVILMLLSWFVLPQELHPAVFPLSLSVLFVCLKLAKPHWIGGKKSVSL